MSIYALLLAAGTSSRMGRPKQLLPWGGQPLARHMARVALASRAAGLIVVLGAAAEHVGAALEGLGERCRVVVCADYATGQAASLRCGLKALPPDATGAVVLLVDQPLVTPPVVDKLIEAFADEPSALMVVPRFQGRRGNPALIAARLFPELLTLAGDTGAREVVARHAEAIRWLDFDDPAVVSDADTPEAFAALQRAAER